MFLGLSALLRDNKLEIAMSDDNTESNVKSHYNGGICLALAVISAFIFLVDVSMFPCRDGVCGYGDRFLNSIINFIQPVWPVTVIVIVYLLKSVVLKVLDSNITFRHKGSEVQIGGLNENQDAMVAKARSDDLRADEISLEKPSENLEPKPTDDELEIYMVGDINGNPYLKENVLYVAQFLIDKKFHTHKKTLAYLTVEFSKLRMEKEFLVLYFASYGSQLSILDFLNSVPKFDEGFARNLFEEKRKTNDRIKNMKYEQYIGFLTNNNLVESNNGMMNITAKGTEFLTFLTKTGYTLYRND